MVARTTKLCLKAGPTNFDFMTDSLPAEKAAASGSARARWNTFPVIQFHELGDGEWYVSATGVKRLRGPYASENEARKNAPEPYADR